MYNEQELRDAFQAGQELGAFVASNNYFNKPLDEDEFIKSIKLKHEKEKYGSLTYKYIKDNYGWDTFCFITGHINDNTIYDDDQLIQIP